MNATWLEAHDRARQRRGAWLEQLGFGPQCSPLQPIHEQELARLWRLLSARGRPPLLLVPAPIKAHYIWDLEPAVSVVRHAQRAGFAPYVLQWLAPAAADRDRGLAAYSDVMLPACAAAAVADAGDRRLLVAGHSLGGTLAALFATLHPQTVQALVLLDSPVCFGAASGAFAPLLGALPPVAALLGNADCVPGSLLNLASVAADPDAFISSRWRDRILSGLSPAAWVRHQRVMRWTLDEKPLSRRLFEETVELLYRRDAFCSNRLVLNGKPVRPSALAAALLCVVDPRSRLVPPASVLGLPYSGRAQRRVLEYSGDIGVALQHVGMLVGLQAHRTLWPRIFAWLHAAAGRNAGRA